MGTAKSKFLIDEKGQLISVGCDHINALAALHAS